MDIIKIIFFIESSKIDQMFNEVYFEDSKYNIQIKSRNEYEKFGILTDKNTGLQYFKTECVIDSLRAKNPYINFTTQSLCDYMMPDISERRLNPQTIVDIQNVLTGIVYDDFIIEYFSPTEEDLEGTYLSMHLFMDFMFWACNYFYDDFEEDNFSDEDDFYEEYFEKYSD